MKRYVAAGVAVLVLLAVFAGPAHMQRPAEDAEAAAKELVDDFFVAFNNRDNETLQKLANYPHAFLLDNGRMAIANDPDELVMDFDAMTEREGWHRSTLDAFEVTNSAPGKVHAEIVFSRHEEDGTKYRTVPALWIITKQDGEWGIQFRSLMPATYQSPN